MTAPGGNLSTEVPVSPAGDLAPAAALTAHPRAAGRGSRPIVSSARGRVGLGLLLLMLLIIVFGRFLAPYPPAEYLVGPVAAGPSGDHWLGTDNHGRDVLSRVLTGGGSVLLIPTTAILIAVAVGGALGLTAGYRGGRVDRLVGRLFDVMLTLPALLVVLVVIAGFGSATSTLILVVGFVFAPMFGRVVRATTQITVVHAYVEAARARGEKGVAIVAREILPNIAAPVLAELGLLLTYGILFTSSISFLGLGVQPPKSDWGLMISENAGFLAVIPLSVLGPAFAIAALCIAFNLIAEAVSEHVSHDEQSRVIRL